MTRLLWVTGYTYALTRTTGSLVRGVRYLDGDRVLHATDEREAVEPYAIPPGRVIYTGVMKPTREMLAVAMEKPDDQVREAATAVCVAFDGGTESDLSKAINGLKSALEGT